MAASLLAKPFLGSSSVIAARSTTRSSGRSSLRVQAADRTLWLPGIDAPKYLTGKLAGDNGFDPLGLGVDSDRLKWYAEAEKTNGRWAMAAVAGILFTDVIGKPVWFEAGAQEYWIDNNALLALEFLFVGALELKRYQGFKETGTSGFLNSFPFDPLGQNSADNAVKEVKNGRLAMVAFVGFAVQALVTRQGPIEALTAHLADPFGNNLASNLLKLPEYIK